MVELVTARSIAVPAQGRVSIPPPGKQCGVCRTAMLGPSPSSSSSSSRSMYEFEGAGCTCAGWTNAMGAVVAGEPGSSLGSSGSSVSLGKSKSKGKGKGKSKGKDSRGGGLALLPPSATLPPGVLMSLHRLRVLVLAGCGLVALPDEFGALRGLAQLDVSANRLTVLPDSLGLVPSLLILRAARNRLMFLPDALACADSLLELDLNDNAFAEPPSILARCKSLRKLSMSGNRLVSMTGSGAWAFPASLEVLDLARNRICDLGVVGAGALESLVRSPRSSSSGLMLVGSSTRPGSWAEAFPLLTRLILAGNAGIASLVPLDPPPPELAILDLSRTAVTWFPGSLALGLGKLRVLRLAGTPCVVLPFVASSALGSLVELTLQDIVCDSAGEVMLEHVLLHLFRATAACPHPLLTKALVDWCAWAHGSLGYDVVRAGVGPALGAVIAHGGPHSDQALELLVALIDASERSKARLLVDGLADSLAAVLARAAETERPSLAAAAVSRLAEASCPYTRSLLLSPLYGGPSLLRVLDTVGCAGQFAESVRASLDATPPGAGTLVVRPGKAMQLMGRKNNSRPYAPYVHLRAGGTSASSKCDYTGGHNPKFKGSFAFELSDPKATRLHVSIYDYRVTSRDILLASASLDLPAELFADDGLPHTRWIKLLPHAPPSDHEPPSSAAGAGASSSSGPTSPVSSPRGARSEPELALSGPMGVSHTHTGAGSATSSSSGGDASPRSVPLYGSDLLATLPSAPTFHSLIEPTAGPDSVPALEAPLYSTRHGLDIPISKISLELVFQRRSASGGDQVAADDGDEAARSREQRALMLASLDASNAIYYADASRPTSRPVRFRYPSLMDTVVYSGRASSQQYGIVTCARSIPGGPVVLVPFMGTYSVGDVVTDLDLGAAPLLEGRVHRGMYRRAASIPILHLAFLLREDPRRRLVLTGHSLGGGVAVLVAARLAVEAGLTSDELARVHVITFGQPLVGDSVFCDWLEAAGVASRVTAYVNQGDIVASITLASPHAAATHALATAGEGLKTHQAADDVVDRLVASLETRLAPLFVAFTPVTGKYVMMSRMTASGSGSESGSGSGSGSGFGSAVDGSGDVVEESFVMVESETGQDAEAGAEIELSELSERNAVLRALAPPEEITSAHLDAHGLPRYFEALFPGGWTEPPAGPMPADGSPTVSKVRLRFDAFGRVVELRAMGTGLVSVTKIKFRGASKVYTPTYLSDTMCVIVIDSVPGVVGANWASLTLRLISPFGEARARVALGRYVNALLRAEHFVGLTRPPQIKPAASLPPPGVVTAVSQRGVTAALAAVTSALSDARVFERLLRSYLFSDAFQEQLAEASDVELALSVVKVTSVTLPRPMVTVTGELNDISVTFSGIHVGLDLGFDSLVLSPYLVYSGVGAHFEIVNLHGSLSISVGATGSRTSYSVNLDDLAVKLGSELVDESGAQVTFKDNWGYSASLFKLFLGSMRRLFLWVLGGDSLRSFLASELESVLVDASLVRVPYGDSAALLVDYGLSVPPSSGFHELFMSGHSGRIVLEGHGDAAEYEAVVLPTGLDALASAEYEASDVDIVVTVSPFVLNTALVSAFLAGMLQMKLTRQDLPAELEGLVAVDGLLTVTATRPPVVTLASGAVTVSAESRVVIRAPDGSVEQEAEIPFRASLDVEDLRVTSSGLEGLDALGLVGEDGEGLASAMAGLGREWANGLSQIYATKMVPAIGRALTGAGVGELRVFKRLPGVTGSARVSAHECGLVMTARVPPFVLEDGEIDEMVAFLEAKIAAADNTRILDVGIGWLDSALRKSRALP